MIKVDLSLLKNWKRLVKFKNGEILKNRNIKEIKNIKFLLIVKKFRNIWIDKNIKDWIFSIKSKNE